MAPIASAVQFPLEVVKPPPVEPKVAIAALVVLAARRGKSAEQLGCVLVQQRVVFVG